MTGFVNHGIRFIGANPEFNLLKYGVLFELSSKVDDVTRCRNIQRMYRRQLAMAMARGANKLDLTYAANCQPCGYRLDVRPRLCQNPKICPFCFVRRRLYPAYTALKDVPADVRAVSKVVSWKRDLPYDLASLRLFSKNYGPHQRLSAFATVQALLPCVGPKNNLQIRHVGIQLVSSECQHESLLEKLYADIHVEPEANNTGIHRAIVFASRLPWRALFSKENTSNFIKIMDDFNRRRLIRINKFKGDYRGNSKPAISEE